MNITLKKIFIIFISVTSISVMSCRKQNTNDKLDSYLNKDFWFWTQIIFERDGNELSGPKGTLSYNEGNWNASFSGSFYDFTLCDVQLCNNQIILELQISNFFEKGNPSYRDWNYPSRCKILLDKEKLDRITNSSEKYCYKIYEKDFFYGELFSSKAVTICNNVRIRENPDTNAATRVVGKLSKWQEVKLIDCTRDKMKIDNLEYPWYKIKLDDGTEGWVYGGFVKIYFDEEELQMLHEAFKQEGSEYTNQFIAADNS